jgi:hypothetical protein
MVRKSAPPIASRGVPIGCEDQATKKRKPPRVTVDARAAIESRITPR